MVKIDLKGQIKEFEQGVTAADVAKSIGMGLYKSACAAKIDGQVCAPPLRRTAPWKSLPSTRPRASTPIGTPPPTSWPRL